MPTSQQIQEAIHNVTNQRTFIDTLLRKTLNWQIPDDVENIEDISFTWSAEELNAEGLDKKIVDGKVSQFQPMVQNQLWGIFLLEFKNADVFVQGRGLTGPLRKILRGLVRKKRQQTNRPVWERENLLFICTYDYKHYRFAYFKAPLEKEKASPLAMFGWNYLDSEIRTLCEHNLPFLEWDRQDDWQQAFSIEKVTKEFYKAYADVFETAESYIAKANKDLKGDKLRLFTQMLFNRLMFLRFVEKKGWLKFGDSRDYLKNLLAAGGIEGKTFYKSRLCPLFFEGLAVEKTDCKDAVGDVPFLNGGLFEITDLDKGIKDVPNEAFKDIIGDKGLFYHFNFTVEESTPFDIEVAVDPEMLGKVFEELVTGRHETGSYYTPRPIVSFMCKEALKGFLYGKTSASKEAIEKLVDDHEVSQGLTELHAEEILYYLDTIKACDPACGSGAYLLGLLQELIAIRRTMQNERLLADSGFMYKLKLGIISRSLYGVDIDEFATNVAKLRLWLSLAVEAENPQPLPNLDFKIETGDSVLGPCTPYLDTEEALTMSALREKAKKLVLKKDRFMMAHGKEKQILFDEIRQEEAAIAKETETVYGEKVIAWHIHFAEVFISGRRQQQIDHRLTDVGTFKTTTIEPGGFDIALANPPYVRHELIKDMKPKLKEVFPELFNGMADFYTYFYTRAVEMLTPGGMLAFISSNKWFRANYGTNLRKYIAKRCRIHSITDFGELPVFETAATFPMVFVAQKTETKGEITFTQVKTLEPPYPDIKAIVERNGCILPADAIKGDSWNLTDSETLKTLRKMESVGVPLKDYVKGEIYVGIKTGLNKAFWIDTNIKEKLIEDDPSSVDLIKKLIIGDDVRKWHVREQDKWLLYIPWKLDIDDYPAVKKHLQKWKDQLSIRPESKEGRYDWWCLARYASDYAYIFDVPKIVYPDIAKEPRFTLDKIGAFVDMTAFMIPVEDYYLLGVLNSNSAWRYLSASAAVLGDANKSGRLRLKRQYVSQLPIPNASSEEKRAIEKLVQKCLDAKGQNCKQWEKEIDEIVTKLYGLEK